MRLYYRNIVNNIFFISGLMPQKHHRYISTRKKIKIYSDLYWSWITNCYFLMSRKIEKKCNVNTKKKIAMRIKQQNCKDAPKKFKYMKNEESWERRKENRGYNRGTCKFSRHVKTSRRHLISFFEREFSRAIFRPAKSLPRVDFRKRKYEKFMFVRDELLIRPDEEESELWNSPRQNFNSTISYKGAQY